MQTIRRMTGEEKSIGKQQFARELSVVLGYPIQDCRIIMDAYESLITQLIKQDISVRLTGFGTFSPKHMEARPYHDVCHHGTYVVKPAFDTIKFKPSEALLKALNDDEE